MEHECEGIIQPSLLHMSPSFCETLLQVASYSSFIAVSPSFVPVDPCAQTSIINHLAELHFDKQLTIEIYDVCLL